MFAHEEAVEYYPSKCGSCGRRATVTSEREINQLCEPCTKMWKQVRELAFCSCPALWGRHSLQCTLRLKDQAT